MYRVGIDIGGTKVNMGIIDNNGRIIASQKAYIKDIKDLKNFIKQSLIGMCETASVSYSEIAHCGIGIPGTVSSDGKRILKSPNISILNENFPGELEALLDIPTAAVQDSRAAAWGEYVYGGGRGFKNVVCITLGTGIGCGIVADGKIYNGALGCAGEMGHINAVEYGRSCGCGKRGCLEKYCAGGGLDITAAELLGKEKTAKDLFEAAENNSAAKKAIDDAVCMLGRAVVSLINLMSPDCVLFSGGLSRQRKFYIDPVIEYVRTHCYNAGTLPKIDLAELGENSPFYGCAFLPSEPIKKTELSASIMCADVLNMEKSILEIEESGIEYLHCDIMDNHFVPNLMFPSELLNKFRKAASVPFDFHIMAENPETIIEKLDVRHGDVISVHYESTIHLERVIALIKSKGAKAAVALNPATPIEHISEILGEIDMVLIMTVNPGFAGQKLVPGGIDKIRRMRKMLDEHGLLKVKIEADGNCSIENSPKMVSAGADILVVGTSGVFKPGISIKEGTEIFRRALRSGNI